MCTYCFGSLGNKMKDCSCNVKKLTKSREKRKEIFKWRSVSNITVTNYI